MIILRNPQGANLYLGGNPSLFCFVPEDTVQMSVLVLVEVLPEAGTQTVLNVARIFLGEVPVWKDLWREMEKAG